MTEAPRTELLQIISNKGLADHVAAPLALRAAFGWCSLAFSLEKLEGSQNAFVSAINLYDALEDGQIFLASIDKVMEIAEPGDTVKRSLVTSQVAINRVVKSLADLRESSAQLLQRDAELSGKETEIIELRKRIETLQHQEILSKHYDALKAQAEALASHLSWVAGKAQSQEEKIEQTAQNLITLSEEQITVLSEEVKSLLDLADKRTNERKQLQEKLDAAKKEFGQAEAMLEEYREAANSYREVTMAIARRVPGTEDMTGMFNNMEQLLFQMDSVIKIAIEANQKANRLPEVGFGGS